VKVLEDSSDTTVAAEPETEEIVAKPSKKRGFTSVGGSQHQDQDGIHKKPRKELVRNALWLLLLH